MASRVLLVEDDLFLREGLSELLTRERYALSAAGDAATAQQLMSKSPFDLIILDVSLPDGDGIALCQRWRAEGVQTPILFLTACDEEWQVVRGLDAGGNDYVVKPFRMQELLSRIRAQLRSGTQTIYRQGALLVDLSHMTAQLGGELLYLTPTEFRILAALIKSNGRVLTRQLLLESIWDIDSQFIDDNTLSVHVSRLREKIGTQRIRTVRGIGYQWEEQP